MTKEALLSSNHYNKIPLAQPVHYKSLSTKPASNQLVKLQYLNLSIKLPVNIKLNTSNNFKLTKLQNAKILASSYVSRWIASHC